MARKKQRATKRKRQIAKPDPKIVIDASPRTDKSVLPVRVNGGRLAGRHMLLTFDRLAEDVGGRDEFVNMCRLSEAPEAMEFVRLCTVDADVSLENILNSMGVRAGKILESVVPALYAHGGQVSKLINALNTPETMKASVKSAKIIGPAGFPDRKMQLEIAGIVEKEKGMTVIGQLNAPGGVERPEATFNSVATRVEDDPENV